MSQYDAREVGDLLSRFNFKILREQEGDFSPSHRKYLCEFSRPGYETFSTSYQCNPEVHGQPTAADVFAALVSDALAVDGYNIDDFADELGFDKPSAAIRAYREPLRYERRDGADGQREGVRYRLQGVHRGMPVCRQGRTHALRCRERVPRGIGQARRP